MTVSIEGAKAKTTNFAYFEEPRETVVSFETEPTTHYQIAPDGSVLKWWNAKVPPEIEILTGSLWTERGEVHLGPISSGDQWLNVKAHAWEGVASIQIVANGNDVVAEKNCEESKCLKLEKELVTETENWAPGVLQLEVIVTDRLGQISSQRFWDNIPYTPPPDPGAVAPPKFAEILHFREEFGLDLDIKGNEQAINERIFELIAAWHDPNSPAGEVARASDERWGVPMRAVDVAEMEYRESYLAADLPLIEEWAQEHRSSTYGGYYVDNRGGGTVYVGFTSAQAEALSELKEDEPLAAPTELHAYPMPPSHSVASLEGIMNSIESSANEILAEDVVELGIDEAGGTVLVGAVEVGQVRAAIESTVGPGAPVTVYAEEEGEPFAGRNRVSGPIEAGDWIWNEQGGENEKGERYLNKCTAGYGAWEALTPKPNGEPTIAEFLLVAGHCASIAGESFYRSSSPAPARPSELHKVGVEKRTGAPLGGQHYETDAAAVRLNVDGSIVPRYIYKTPRSSRPVREAGAAHHGETLCFSGAHTDDVKCGEMMGVRYRKFGTPGRHLFIVTRFAGIPGDSGAPVWSPRTGLAVGLLSGGPKNGKYKDWVTPLTRPRGFPVEKVPGALNAPGMGSLQLAKAE